MINGKEISPPWLRDRSKERKRYPVKAKRLNAAEKGLAQVRLAADILEMMTERSKKTSRAQLKKPAQKVETKTAIWETLFRDSTRWVS